MGTAGCGMTPPRPECPTCNAWEPRRDYCGHKIVYGPTACLLDDEERMRAWEERMEMKAKEGK